jgi:large subunit ribosomal protein L10
MNKSQKEVVVASIKEQFSDSAASFLVGVKGLTVEQLETLRGELRKEDGRLQIAKVRLMKRALQDVESVQHLESYMQNQVGLVFAKKEVPGVAKVLCGLSKKMDALSVVVGTMDANLLDESAIQMMATLPSREVLLGQVARTLQAPYANLTSVLHQMIARIAYVLKQVEQKKQNS